MIIETTFKPAWWLTNPHAQTIYPKLMRRLQAPIDRTEHLELPDGDFIELLWADAGLSLETPLVIFLHGLTGGVTSPYVAGQLNAFNRAGWRAVLIHFRGSGQEPNRLPRLYHSGETGDLHVVIQVLANREPTTKKAVVGFSLGGNVLLKWLGEQGKQAFVDAAVAVSVPFLLNVVADKMNQGFSRIYQTHLLKKMHQMFSKKLEKYPETCDIYSNQADSVSCFWTFDDRITAPLHGFPHVHAYYRESSSRQYLSAIATPTLIIHSLDDPFMTASVVPCLDELSSDIILELSPKGGHVGFISGNRLGKPIYWLDQRIPEFLKAKLS